MKAEESLKSCLGRITDALPNLEVYRSVYPDPELGQSLSKAYKEIIFFGREATLYFLGSGFGKKLSAILKFFADLLSVFHRTLLARISRSISL